MKVFVIGAAIAATLATALPATAEVVVRERGNAVVVHHDHHWRGHHYGWRSHADCRTVRVKTRTPSGAVSVKTRRTC